MNKKYLITLFILCISLSSCLKIYFRIYGIKKCKAVTIQNLSSFLTKNLITDSLILQVDSIKYQKLINTKNIDTLNYNYASWWTQNHIQPIQVIYFDIDSNKSVAAFFNCIAETKGISTMTWNKDKELEQFPPIAYRKWCDSLFTYNEIINTIVDLKTGKSIEYVPRKKYLILVLYSLFIEKQTLNLIREINYNLSKQKTNNYELYYINMDNYFYSQFIKKKRMTF